MTRVELLRSCGGKNEVKSLGRGRQDRGFLKSLQGGEAIFIGAETLGNGIDWRRGEHKDNTDVRA